MSLWQAEAVPSQNAQTEFDHYVNVQDDILKLRSAHIDAAESGIPQSPSIKLGTTYQPRTFFVNGPPPQGRLYTTIQSNGTITANGVDLANVCGYNSDVTTRSIQLDTNYEYFSDAEAPPYVYENTVVYRQPPNGNPIFETEQILVQGSTINIYPLADNVSASGVGTTSLNLKGAATGQTEVGGPISITLPTALSAADWEELLNEQSNVDSVSQVASDRVRISLADVRWTIRCAAVGIDDEPDVDPAVPPTGDTTGPLTKNIQTDIQRLDQGDRFDLTAVVTDVGRGGVDILAAEWYSNKSIGTLSEPVSMAAADGQFDEPNETVSDTDIDTDGWPTGVHNLSVRGQDANENWGANATTLLTIFIQPERIVYVDSNSGTLKTINTDGTVRTYTTSQVKAIGPMTNDLDGDADRDLPYVNSNDNLRFIDDDGNQVTLDSSGSVKSKSPRVGDWDGDGTIEVIYVRNDRLYEVENGGSPTQIQNIKVNAVGDVGDFDGDGKFELVYVDDKKNLKYIDDDSSIVSVGSVSLNKPQAIGRLEDYDDDGELEIPFYDNQDKGIDFANDSQVDQSFTPGYDVAAVSMGEFNWTGDSTPEIIHLDSNGEIRYLNPDDGSTGTVGSDTADTNQGAV